MSTQQAMPLAELRSGHIAHNRNVMPQGMQPRQASTPTVDSKATFTPTPSSLQNMLKNTTETGNVSVMPAKINRSPATLKAGLPEEYGISSSLPHDGDLQVFRGNIHNRPRFRPDSPSHDTNGSSTGSSRLSRIVRTRQIPGAQMLDEDRSWSMTQSSHVSHSLAKRYPHVNQGYQPRGVGPNGRPRSPFAYPTRLKRPGYRPSSPALSDVNHPGYGSSYGSRPASPASVHSMSRLPLQWQQHSNHSDSHLRYYSPAHGSGSVGDVANAQGLDVPPLNRSTHGLRGVPSSSRLPRGQPSMVNLYADTGNSPPSPLFYDYSEGFEDEGRPTHLSTSSTSLNKQSSSDMDEETPVTEQSQTGAGPVELPTADREYQPLPPTETIAHSARSQAAEHRESAIVSTQPYSELEDKAATNTKRYTIGTSIPGSKENNHDNERLTQPMSFDGNCSARSRISLGNNHGRTMGDIKPAESIAESANTQSSPRAEERSDSSSASMCTAESNSYDKLDSSSLKIALPSAMSCNEFTSSKIEAGATFHEGLPDSEPQRTSFSESRIETTEIVSPTPERSITSPVNRHRFSRILGLDDGLSELDNATHASYDLRHRQKEGSSLPAVRIRESFANDGTINTSILQLSDSEDENELSPSLMRIFGRQEEREEVHNSSLKESSVQKEGYPSAESATVESTTKQSDTFPKAASSDPATALTDSQQISKNVVSVKTSKNRHAQIPDPCSKPSLRLDKDLPPVPEEHRSIITILPPAIRPTELPFAFTPINRRLGEDDTISELVQTSEDSIKRMVHESDLDTPPSVTHDMSFDKDSVASSHESRPWNKSSNYPWSTQPPNLEVGLPGVPEGARPATGRFPRFKLRIHRASTSTTGSGKLTKRRASSEATTSSPRSSGHFFSPNTSTPKVKSKPRQPSSPGQINSSHDIGNESLHTRFVESFDMPPQINTEIGSPTIILLPPSPGHEVRSFFSDDSSQVGQKRSLRKRLSNLKVRHSQASPVEESRAYDRGLLHSALGKSRASGRSSRQSQYTAGAKSHTSRINRASSVVFRKVRFWWNRSESKLRGWSSRMRSRQGTRPATLAELYPGT